MECIEETIPADDNALYDIKFEETGDQMMLSTNYIDEENGDIKPFLDEIINDLNEHKNIENDCVLTKLNNSNIKIKKVQVIGLSEHYGLDVVKKDKPFIQVLYNGSAHWICVFNFDRNRS